MGAVDVLVLGLISEKPRHGYEINREIDSRGYRQWVKASDVAVYKALARLERGGWLVSLTERGGKSPERCVFNLTESGRERLSDLLYDQLSSQEPLRNEFFLSFEFPGVLKRSEISLALEKRLVTIGRLLEGRRLRLEMVSGLEDEFVIGVCRHEVDLYQLEFEWLKDMLALARKL